MPVLDESKFAKGESEHNTGHVIYKNAIYTDGDNSRSYILKENKHGNAEFSYLEVAFSKIASLFLAKDTSCETNLVVNNETKEVEGIAVEHLGYTISKKNAKRQNPEYYKFSQVDGKNKFEEVNPESETKIPFTFLDKLEHDTLSQLMNMRDQGVDIDYKSLAAIFTSSYSLEEDDLHKGNFGFYCIGKGDLIEIKFFKIDHDLMFADSLMSFVTRRYFHLAHGADAFAITKEDLLKFPLLTQSTNGYWPAKSSYFANPLSSKDFVYNSEIEAFQGLGNNPEFKKAKWFYFLKHILIPQQAFKDGLEESFDKTKAVDKTYISLVLQALVARQACLRATLFSIKEFRDYIDELTPEDEQKLIEEISQHNQVVAQSIKEYKKLGTDNIIDKDDTPLHVAIKLGDYRFEETLRMHGEHLDQVNSKGLTPLDCAYELYLSQQKDSNVKPSAGHDYLFIIQHLLGRGATSTKEIDIPDLDKYTHQSKYHEEINDAKTYAALKLVLQNIGEDCSYSLKGKKRLAVECLEIFIEKHKSEPNFTRILQKIYDDINGYSSAEDQAPLKYIRQLRSKLWIVRQIRGLYGNTSTLGEMNGLINQQLTCAQRPSSCCFSFFGSTVDDVEDDNDIQLDNVLTK